MSSGDDLVQILTDQIAQWSYLVEDATVAQTLEETQAATPVVSGQLRAAETGTVGGGFPSYEAVMESPTEYSSWVDLGRGPVRPVTARVLHFTVGGQDVFAMYAGPSEPRDFFENPMYDRIYANHLQALLGIPIGG